MTDTYMRPRNKFIPIIKKDTGELFKVINTDLIAEIMADGSITLENNSFIPHIVHKMTALDIMSEIYSGQDIMEKVKDARDKMELEKDTENFKRKHFKS